MSKRLFYLDCPFEQKDDAKALGARWDRSAKRWFVPDTLLKSTNVYKFKKWIPPRNRLYLNCPFGDKDKAKDAGAKWDGEVKAWYVQDDFTPSNLKKFSKWLQFEEDQDDDIKPITVSLSPTKSKPSIKTKASSRGNAENATTLKIGDNMTVGQLQEECRLRGIRGLSGKSKDWLLEQLGVGSVWQTTSLKNHGGGGVNKPTPAKPKARVSTPAKKEPAVVKATPSAERARPIVATKTAPPISDTKSEKANKKTVADIQDLPKVNSDMTVAQLMHELLHRQPQTKGTSNKSKPWFLEQLGEHSIWSTSSEAITQGVSDYPVVSSSLTIAQLTHEVMSRRQQQQKSDQPIKGGGLSSKTKPELMKLVGIGSILTTGIRATTELSTTKTTPTPAKAMSPTAKKRPPKPDSTRSASLMSTIHVKSSKPSPPQPSFSSSSIGSSKPTNITEKNQMRAVTVKKEPVAYTATVKWKVQDPPGVVLSSQDKRVKTTTAASTRQPDVTKSTVGMPTKKRKVEAQVVASMEQPRPTIPVVTDKMTLVQLKEEVRTRTPNAVGYSSKNKGWLLSVLGAGTELHSSTEYQARKAREGAERKAAADAAAAKLHTFKSRCHSHPLADSSRLRAPPNNSRLHFRNQVGQCDVEHPFVCNNTAHWTCESCDWDICQTCFRIESLPTQHERHRAMQQAIDQRREEERLEHEREREREREWQRQKEASRRREEEQERQRRRKREQRMEAEYGEELRKFPPRIRNPPAPNKDEKNKLQFTVWTKDDNDGDMEKHFDSSFAMLTEANLRVEYTFYFDNPSERDRDRMYAEVDTKRNGGLRYLQNEAEYDRSRLVVSVLPSEVFDILESLVSNQGSPARDFGSGGYAANGEDNGEEEAPQATSFAENIRKPTASNTNQTKKLTYTVWTSCGYDPDGWHSYQGLPDKEFNSSYRTLHEANQRAQYVFYYQNPWGLVDDKLPFPEINTVTDSGFRRLECCPDDSERWTVSVIPSIAFEYINV